MDLDGWGTGCLQYRILGAAVMLARAAGGRALDCRHLPVAHGE